jgi:hypothetical protein
MGSIYIIGSFEYIAEKIVKRFLGTVSAKVDRMWEVGDTTRTGGGRTSDGSGWSFPAAGR